MSRLVIKVYCEVEMGLYDGEKEQVVKACQALAEKGFLVATGGNLSLMTNDRKAFAITPSNYDYFKMTPDDVCILDFELNVIEGKLKPSVESGMHCAIFKVRPDVRAIIHTHQIYASTLALINASIPALYDEQVRFLGRSVQVIPYAPSGTGMLHKKVAHYVSNHNNAYILKNHGALCFGENLERACYNVEILEKCALTYLLALCTERKVSKIPFFVREVAFRKLREDQKKFGIGESKKD